MLNGKNKGNPVPSLETKEINIICKLLGKAHFNSSPNNNTYIDLLKKLQNGVETDNEQPKQCEFAIITMADTLIGFTDTKDRDILDDELGIHPDDNIEFIQVPPIKEITEQLFRTQK